MHISVRLLYRFGKRLDDWEVLTSSGVVGYLVLEHNDFRRYREARLISRSGRVIAMLIHARIEQCGPRGMLVEGVEPRQRGSKHAWMDKQAWWCHAPPRPDPLRTLEQVAGRAGEFSSLHDEIEVRMGQLG